ncbi:MAG: pyridoxamine 5'-phosphate oxidase family protein [Solirubrobacterales bacterium]|nr:pyridoxamine 5'-phosphate oxidase family protein [Solirubrobacterales bacterium]
MTERAPDAALPADPTQARAEELFHEGEREVQRRAGVADVALRVGRGALQTAIDPEFSAFLAQRMFLVAGAPAPDRRVWASLLAGPPGFARALDSKHLHLVAKPPPGDPLAAGLAAGPVPLGLLALDALTRSRVRLNGTATPTQAGILVTVDEVYGNCPKYIAQRVPVQVIGDGHPDPTRRDGTHLTGDQRAFVRATDTAFVASAHAQRGGDASHRGGRPGFLEVGADGRRVILPDYTGNRMFQTLGNLTVDPRIGMLVVDWETGRTLQFAGTAEVLWDGPVVHRRPKVDRVVIIDVEAVVEQACALPIRFDLREAHHLTPPLPGG